MIDKQKVIKGLECCATNRLRHEDCEAMNCTYLDLDGHGCIHQLIRDALAMVKEQEPVEPVFERQFMSSINIYDCGKCGTSLGAKGIAKYCMECGQAVKWE